MVHPYIPNSDPKTKREMLRFIGAKSIDDLFSAIPTKMQTKRRLDLPRSKSEQEVRKQVEAILSKNTASTEVLSFLGGGCWPHYVPAVCDEINSRSEFLTAYTGDVYSDLGRYQALFEFQSMIGDLVEMDAVTFPIYDWATAAGDSLRMAQTVTGRSEVLVPATAGPDRLSVIRKYCGEPNVRTVGYRRKDGQLDLQELEKRISRQTAAVYIENPSYLGFVETHGKSIARTAHDAGALFVVGVEPLSLGVLAPPGAYGADIACGEAQPLGMHMGYGGVSIGFLACPDEGKFLSATGHRLVTIARTERVGEWGFTYALPDRSMFSSRDRSASITGTTTVIWSITAAVFLSLLGPRGIYRIGETIMQKSKYASRRLSEIEGVTAPLFRSPHFEEFTVSFDGSGKKVAAVNRRLLRQGIFGGIDLSREFPELGETALYCVTEMHSKDDIDRLVLALDEAVRR